MAAICLHTGAASPDLVLKDYDGARVILVVSVSCRLEAAIIIEAVASDNMSCDGFRLSKPKQSHPRMLVQASHPCLYQRRVAS